MALKDLKLIMRDKLGMFFMLIFPVFMAIFFGSIMGSPGSSGSSKLKVVVVDEDKSEMSALFAQSLTDNDAVAVTTMERAAGIESVRKGEQVGVVILPPKFGETAGLLWADSPPAIELGIDPSRQAESGMLQGMVMQAAGSLIGKRFEDPASMKPFFEDSKAQIAADDSIPLMQKTLLTSMMTTVTSMFDSMQKVQDEQQANNNGDEQGAGQGFGMNQMQLANVKQIDVSRKVDPNSRAGILKNVRSKWDISFPQSMVWAILSCVAGFATLIVREKTLGTHTRLQVAPVPRSHLLIGKGLACFICLLCVLSLLIGIACLLGMRPRRWDLLAMSLVSIGICFVGLMLPLSLLGKTEQAVSGTVWGLCTVMAMFGGGMVPVMFMPEFVQRASHFNPVKWAVLSMEGAIWRGFAFSEMLLPWSVLIGVGIVALSLGTWMTSRQTA